MSAALRVLMVTRETGPDRRWGLGRSLMPVVDGLQARGTHVRYFCQDDLSAHDIERREAWLRKANDAPLLRANAGWRAILRAWVERLQVGKLAAKLALADSYTHVHAHDPWLAAGVWWGLGGEGRRRVRWGVTQHGFGCYAVATHEDGLVQGRAMQRLLRAVESWILARCDWVMAPTQGCLAQIARDLGLAGTPEHWHAVPHARPAMAVRTPESHRSARQQLGWSDEAFVVVALGRVVPLKGFDRLVSACARQGLPRVQLVVLGEGEADALRAHAQALGFGSQLHIMVVPDVTPYLHGADLYVSASSSEAFGLANLEALCCGVPSICTAVGGVPEVMGDAAWLVPTDVDSLARAIAAMMADDALRAGWAQRAAAHGARWPDAAAITQRYVDIYQAPRRG